MISLLKKALWAFFNKRNALRERVLPALDGQGTLSCASGIFGAAKLPQK